MKKASLSLSIIAVTLSVVSVFILAFIFAFWDVIFKFVSNGYAELVKPIMTVPWNYMYSLVFGFITAMVVLLTSKSNNTSAIIEILLVVFAIVLYDIIFRLLHLFQNAFVNGMGAFVIASLSINTRILSIVFYLSDIVRLLIIFICGMRIYEKWLKKRNSRYKLTGIYSTNGGRNE